MPAIVPTRKISACYGKIIFVLHTAAAVSVAIGTTDISDTKHAVATSGGVRNINIENIHILDSVDIKNIDPNLADKKIVTDATQKTKKAPIGTTSISDTGAVHVRSVDDTTLIGAADIQIWAKFWY